MPDTNLGLLTGLMGIGAILNAYSIFYLRKKLSDNQLTTLALFLVSIVVYLVPHAHGFNTLAVIMLLFGYSWSIAISVFNGILQADFPAEVRSRIIGIYCVFFAGSQAISSYLSGILVHNFGLANSLLSISLFALLVCVAYLPELLPLIRLQKSKLSSN